MNSFDPSLKLLLENPEETLRALDVLDGEESLLAFTRRLWPVLEPQTPFVEGWAIEAICEHLEAVTDGKITRLLMNVPPGFMKSLLTNVFWPAWEWGPQRLAHHRFVTFSYAASLTERDNRRFLDLIRSPEYGYLWGGRFELKKAGETLVSNDKTGWKLASSVGGVATGERGDRILCLPYDEKVLTNRGWMAIGDVVEGRVPVEIAGKSSADSIEWQSIDAYEKNPGRPLVEIVCDTNTLRCTADHRVFVEGRGYVAASSIRAGEAVRTYGIDTLPKLRRDDLRQAEPHFIPKVLFAGLPFRSSTADFSGREQSSLFGLCEDGLSTTRAFGSDSRRSFLFPRLLRQVQCGGEQPRVSRRAGSIALRVLWQRIRSSTWPAKPYPHLLKAMRDVFGLVREAISSRVDPRSLLRQLWQDFSPVYECGTGGEVLLSEVRCGIARTPHEGERQRTVCPWGCFTSVSRWLDTDIQGGNSNARWGHLQALWGGEQAGGTSPSRASYRLCEEEHGRGKSDHALPILPRENARFSLRASGMERAVVRAVNPAGYADVTYNLRVGPHHNYFAEGVLVHNCDDPHSVKESESDAVRGETVRWFREGMSNRLNNMETSAIVVIMQRVHESDVSGTIIDSSADYTHLMIPMEYDGRRYTTSIGWTDPREHDGELAWPERFPASVVKGIKDIGTAYSYAGQYQQTPAPRGGGIFRREWWQLWGNAEDPKDLRNKTFPACEYIVASLDSAYTEKEENDYSAFTIWGLWRDEHGLPKVILLHAWRDRLALHDLVEKSAASCKRFKVDRLLIEAKASGLSVAQEMRRLYIGEGWAVQLIDPKGDKVARAYAVQGLFSDEMIYAPDRTWADMVITEMASFPRAPHDDLVDSSTMALKHLRQIGLAVHGAEIQHDLTEDMRHQSGASKPLYGAL